MVITTTTGSRIVHEGSVNQTREYPYFEFNNIYDNQYFTKCNDYPQCCIDKADSCTQGMYAAHELYSCM
jgi:hypothetical protein